MTTNEHRAAWIIGRELSRWRTEGRPDMGGGIEWHLARALADAGLLLPDGVQEEWESVVAWRNPSGQVEQQKGRGPTRDDALDAAREKQYWLVNSTEVAHRCGRRLVSPWEEEDTTHTKGKTK